MWKLLSLKHCNSIAYRNSLSLPLMKIFAFIMACVIILLSFTYCAEGAIIIKDKKAKIESIKKAETSKEDLAGNCSPFCQCASCPGFSIPAIYKGSLKAIPLSTKILAHYLSSKITSISQPVWQPPQLVS